MFSIKIADTVIGIQNKYEYIKHMCRDYITDEPASFSVSANDEEIMREDTGDVSFPAEYLETLAIYRKISDALSEYDAFLMHGVLMEAEGRGILLCAESGTGKSTHAMLWLSLLGERCRIINGDKPLIRIIDGVPYAYGTPWCGKEEINENSRVRLSDICFLRRNEENSATPSPKSEVVAKLLPSVHLPRNGGLSSVLEAVDTMAQNVRFWDIACNMDISAAKTILKQWEEILNKIPYIGDNGHWYIYNVEEKRYEDSGVSAA